MNALPELVGSRLGLLVVRGRYSDRRGRKWVCRCDCGRVLIQTEVLLRGGADVHCGRCPFRRYGFLKSAEYRAWASMVAEHAKGVAVHPAWLGSVLNFAVAIGPRPTLTHSLTLIDPTLGYVPGNCHWTAPPLPPTLSITELSILSGIPYGILYYRIKKKKMTPEQAMAAPYRNHKEKT